MKEILSGVVSVASGLAIWVALMVTLGFVLRVNWELVMIGWRLL